MPRFADRVLDLTQSDIRAVTTLTREVGGINLGQGICDMPTPSPIKDAARAAIDNDRSIYTNYAGIDPLREALLEKVRAYNDIPATSADDIMVSAGSTGAFVAAIHALLNAGDEVIVFEPFYGYHRNLLHLVGANLRYVTTQGPDWAIDPEVVAAQITPKTKALLICTPNNPTGKVWSRAELEAMLDLAQQHDLYIITDEIYEYMLYDGHTHISMASLPGAYERTITLSGFSKTYNMTGWRLGYAVAPASITEKMGLVNDLIYICAPSPLQYGVTAAFEMGDAYFDEMTRAYTTKRALLCDTLEKIGFAIDRPQGAYYVFADFSPLTGQRAGFDNDQAACRTLIHNAGVAAVPGGSFFQHASDGASYLRFCYAKEMDVLEAACEQLLAAFGSAVEA